MNEDKLKESCRSIGNSLMIAGIISAFFSTVSVALSFAVMLIGIILIGYGVKE